MKSLLKAIGIGVFVGCFSVNASEGGNPSLEDVLNPRMLMPNISGRSALTNGASGPVENCEALQGKWAGGCELKVVENNGSIVTVSRPLNVGFRKLTENCHIVMDWKLGNDPAEVISLNLGKIKNTVKTEGFYSEMLNASFVWDSEEKRLGFTYGFAMINSAIPSRLTLSMTGMYDLTFNNPEMASLEGIAFGQNVFQQKGKPNYRTDRKTADWKCRIYRQP